MSDTFLLALELLAFRDSIKFYHWSTTTYSRHTATCALVDTMDTLIDKIIETYAGRYGRPRVTEKKAIGVLHITDANATATMKTLAAWLMNVFPTFVESSDTDLLNLRDELLNEVEKTIYLFGFTA